MTTTTTTSTTSTPIATVLNTTRSHDGFSSYTRTSIARVSRGFRQDRMGEWNYGVYFDGKNGSYKGWVNVYPQPGSVKLFQGQYVWVDSLGQIITDDSVQQAFDDIESFD